LCGELAAEGPRLDVVRAGPHAVDLDHRDQLAVTRLELGVATDVDLLQVERELVAKLLERCPCTLAEVAALGVVEDDLGRYGYRPRVVVASATRWTARP
jgi:hypothetical protein